MIAYIVRRLIAAVLLLFVVSAVTFVDLLPGAAARRGRPRRPSPPATSADRRRRRPSRRSRSGSASTDPLYVQYGRCVKGVVVGADYDTGAGVEHCPAPCLGYSFMTRTRCCPTCSTAPGDALAGRRRGGAAGWSAAVAIGVLSALRRGTHLRPRRDGRRARRRVAADLLHRPAVAVDLQLRAAAGRRRAALYPIDQDNPVEWAHALILPWITLAFLYAAQYARLTRAGMLETMGEDFIRTARAKGLRERTVVVKHGLRAALTPILTIFGLDLGLLLGGAVLTESTFSLHGHRASTRWTRSATSDLPKVLGVMLVARDVHHHRQPDRRPAVRRRRPEGAHRHELSRTTSSSSRTPGRGRRSRRRAPALPRRAGPAGALPDRRRRGEVRRRAVVPARARQDAGHRRRVRLRQERDQPVDHGSAQGGHRADHRRDPAGRREPRRRWAARRCAGCAARTWR